MDPYCADDPSHPLFVDRAIGVFGVFTVRSVAGRSRGRTPLTVSIRHNEPHFQEGKRKGNKTETKKCTTETSRNMAANAIFRLVRRDLLPWSVMGEIGNDVACEKR